MSSIVYGGLDVHKESIVAHLICKETGEVITQQLQNDRNRLLKAVGRWSKLGELRLCYEASGAGFVVKRWLDAAGVHCDVIAPSLIPKAPGDRVKTDKRDARHLATQYAAGALHVVRVPTPEEETVRALVRLREDLTLDMTRVKNRILKYLRTLGFSYREGKNWTQKFRAWVRGLTLEPLQRLILDTHFEELDGLVERREGIDRRIAEIAQTDAYRDKVQRLMTLRGIGLYSAMVLATEIGDARRFSEAPRLMSYFGLVPSEASSGDSRRTGKITKAGSRRARWILTEAAWNQRCKPKDSEVLRKRRHGQPPAVVAIAKRAEKRLHAKFWKVGLRKDQRTAVTAVAREMAGFVWAILTVEVA
jgi:transposase